MAMSKEHKAALKKGREESRAIRQYLDALNSRKPGRPASPERLKVRVTTLRAKIEDEANPLKKVELVQQRLDAEKVLKQAASVADWSMQEKQFIRHAKSYSQRKGIGYSAWREAGVPAEVLRRAGIPRSRKS